MIEPEAHSEAEWYEPWQPQIGQRVRIRASAECPTQAISPLPDGATGVVSEIEPARGGHRYAVLLDNPTTWIPPLCAAIGLEPLEWAEGAA